ncbi:unnamed protein product, partial [Laminaria digitata]
GQQFGITTRIGFVLKWFKGQYLSAAPTTVEQRELAKFDENRPALGMLNPRRDKNAGMYRSGEGAEGLLCDPGSELRL